MTNNIAPGALNMAIAQVLSWTDAADHEQHAPTGADHRAGSSTRMASTHGCLAAQRRDTAVSAALKGCPKLAREGWLSDPPGCSSAPPRVLAPPRWWWCKPPTIGCAQRVGGAA